MEVMKFYEKASFVSSSESHLECLYYFAFMMKELKFLLGMTAFSDSKRRWLPFERFLMFREEI